MTVVPTYVGVIPDAKNDGSELLSCLYTCRGDSVHTNKNFISLLLSPHTYGVILCLFTLFLLAQGVVLFDVDYFL